MLTIAPCVFLQRGGRRLREEQRRAQVGADEIVPVLDGDLADRRGEERRRVVDQAVEAAEGRQRLLDQRRELGDVEEIGLDQRHRARADVVELGLQQARFAGGAPEVDHQVGAGGVQAATDRRSHPSRATGNQHRLALHRKPSPAGIGAPPRVPRRLRAARSGIRPRSGPSAHAPTSGTYTSTGCLRRDSAAPPRPITAECKPPTCRCPTPRRSPTVRAWSRRPRGDCPDRRLDPVRPVHGDRAARAGARLLRRRCGQAGRRRRLHDGAGDDAAVRRRAGHAGRGDPARELGARHPRARGRHGPPRARPPAGAGRARRAADALCDPRIEPRPRLPAARDAAGAPAGSFSRVEWLSTLPAAIDGAILANEVLDAVPVHLVAAPGWPVPRARCRRGRTPGHAGMGGPAGAGVAGGAGAQALPGRRRLRERNQPRSRGAGRGARPDPRARRRAPHRLRLRHRRVLPSAARHGNARLPLPPPGPPRPAALAGALRHHRARRLRRHRRGRRARRARGRRIRRAGAVPAGLRRAGARSRRPARRIRPRTYAPPPPCSGCCRRRRWASCSRCWRSRAATASTGRASPSSTGGTGSADTGRPMRGERPPQPTAHANTGRPP